ncbi:Nucleotide-binding protein [Frankliniella fusca]|uniref:Nucleotide-binding protein n=1 Tax=Frankliniella fusca TaxID=407009 RepID=A0AAE1LJQ8_9NEOP|nr:Nucleotide-binding protein [Frankliniella fusca]
MMNNSVVKQSFHKYATHEKGLQIEFQRPVTIHFYNFLKDLDLFLTNLFLFKKEMKSILTINLNVTNVSKLLFDLSRTYSSV